MKSTKKYQVKTNNGITLIALVITIIVLLILAGVTISALSGDNGILQNAIKAKEETEVSGEIEQISILISENQIKEHILGEKLKEIEFNITENTKSIIDSITGEIYGNGWYYLTPQNSEELQLKNSYIVNYEKGEIVRFEESKHKIVTNELKCITEGLVYAADPKNMTNGDNWGDAILHNFNEGDANSGWTENALMFDGVDDGIEVEDKSDYSNGITLEIYFKFRGKVENQLGQILMMKRKTTYDGFFMFIGNKEEEDIEHDSEYRRLYIDIGGSNNRLKTLFYVEENMPTYITYTFNPNIENEKGILYINGEKNYTTNIGNIEHLVESQKEANIQIGSDIHKTNFENNNYPLNGEIYAARIYNRALTEQEVKYNYDATVNK